MCVRPLRMSGRATHAHTLSNTPTVTHMLIISVLFTHTRIMFSCIALFTTIATTKQQQHNDIQCSVAFTILVHERFTRTGLRTYFSTDLREKRSLS